MSRYVSFQELVARYKKAAEEFDSVEQQEGFINGAEADVDARLAVRYTVPFSPVPPAIKDIVIDLAYFKMIFGQEMAKPLKEYIDERLNALVNGSSSLVNSMGVIATIENLPWSDTMDRRTQFGVDDPENWSVSTEWQEDEANKRMNDE